MFIYFCMMSCCKVVAVDSNEGQKIKYWWGSSWSGSRLATFRFFLQPQKALVSQVQCKERPSLPKTEERVGDAVP